MKKLIFLLVLFLVSCSSPPNIPKTNKMALTLEAGIDQPNTQSLNTLQLNEQCPHLCWLGINPGVTTYQEAKTIMSSSDQIDQKRLEVTPSEISAAVWHSDPTDFYDGNAAITFENGIVKTIILGVPQLRIKDITKLIGEPDKISYFVVDVADGPGKIAVSAIYFSSHKIMITTGDDWSGPDPDNQIDGLYLNTEFNNTILPDYRPIQPWLGYGHIEEYLPDVATPRPNNPSHP
jgi:hypothetical protein